MSTDVTNLDGQLIKLLNLTVAVTQTDETTKKTDDQLTIALSIGGYITIADLLHESEQGIFEDCSTYQNASNVNVTVPRRSFKRLFHAKLWYHWLEQ